MQTSKKDVVKALVAVACLLAMLIGFSVLIIAPMLHAGTSYYADADTRKQTAGDYDFLFIGDSDGLTAFRPSLFDEQTGYTSYNLSSTMMTTETERYLLEKEMQRNPVKHVVLQFSYETFCRDPEREHGDGNSTTVQRLDNFGECCDFLIRNVDVDQCMDIHSRLLTVGLSFWKDKLTGNLKSNYDASARGWRCTAGNDLQLSDEEVVSVYNSRTLSMEFTHDYTEEIASIFRLCKDYNVDIIVVILPVSAEHIWRIDGWDRFYDWASDFCADNQVPMYDFNLYKGKNDLFSDAVSYKDYAHMSEEGANAFSTAFGQVMQVLSEGKDPSSMFYTSYSEMKADSPYAEIYNSNK